MKRNKENKIVIPSKSIFFISFIFFFLFLIPFISADFGYNNPTLPNLNSNKILGSDINNDLNWVNASGVNGSFYLNSNPFSFYNSTTLDLSSYYLSNNPFGFFNSTTLNLSSYIPYINANQNIDLGNNNFTINNNTFFVNSNTGYVGVGTTTPTHKLEVAGEFGANMISSEAGFNIQYVPSPTGFSGTLQTGMGLEIGKYYYRILYYTAQGHTASSVFNIITTSGNQQVLLNLPVSSDHRVVGRKIYRSPVSSWQGNTALIATIANNVDTSYLDSLPDSSLGTTSGEAYNSVDTTSGYLTANGVKILIANSRNTALGSNALTQNTGGSNTAIGSQAGKVSGTSASSVFIGGGAGYGTNGNGNVEIGVSSGFASSGNSNVFIGNVAGYKTQASNSILIGSHAGFPGVISGTGNMGIGYYSMYMQGAGVAFTGTYNLFLGYQSGQKNYGQVMSVSNSIAIGKQAYTTKSNQIVLGNSAIAETILKGNIGIGIDNPSDLLTLNTSTNDAGITLMGATTGISPAFKLANATGNIFARFGIAGGTNELVTGSSQNDLVIRTENKNIFLTTDGGLSPSMIINISGNVGIGVTPSNARLQINGGGVGIGTILAGDLASGSTLAIGDSDTGFKQQGDGILATYTNNVERTRIDTSGYMGVGTTTPTERLDVSGNLKVSGDIYTDKWQDYNAYTTITGFSSFTYATIRYKKIGNLVFVNYNIEGVSNSNVFTFTLPYTNSNQSYSDVNAFGVGTDNGVTQTNPHMYLPTDSNIVTAYRNSLTSSWTSYGTKRMNGQFWYEAN